MRFNLRQKIINFIRTKKRFREKSRSKYDFVFSLGEACFVAATLKNCGLRSCATPYDWLYGGKTRLKFLLNDFKNFINKEDLKSHGKRTELLPANLYINTRNDIHFIHDFPLDSDLEKEYPKVKQKYDRRIKNLLKKLYTCKRTLMVYACLPGSRNELEPNFTDIIKKINQKFKNKIDLLYIKHNETLQDNEFFIRNINKNIRLVECNNKAPKDEPIYNGNYHNLQQILELVK